MIAPWSDSDSSNIEDEEEQTTSLWFMVNEDQVQEDETEYECSDEVDYSNLLDILRIN